MAAHSSVLAWRTPGTGEPCGLPSMVSYRVGHNWSDLAAAATAVCDLSSHSLEIDHTWLSSVKSYSKIPLLREARNLCPSIALISHTSKVILKILQARLQQYVNRELPDVQAGFRKGRRTKRSNCQHLLDHRKSKRVPEKHLFLLYWLCQSLWLCGSQ